MKTWKKVTLREVADIIPGYAFKGEDFCITGAPVIKIKDINPPSVLYDTLERVDLSRYKNKNIEKYTAAKNDFVIAMTGATIGKVGKIRFSDIVYINQRVAKIRPKDAVCWDFIYYCAISNLFYQHIINNIDSNSAQENISATSIGSFSFYLPPLPEQKAIAGVLSSLDDKIDLLQRQNATLEAMAETLFRQWFIEEAQEDWEEKTLEELFDISIGRTPPRKEQWHFLKSNGNIWISIKDMGGEGAYISDSSEYLTAESIYKYRIPLIKKNSVLLSFKMTVGRVKISTQDMYSNEAIACFYPKKGANIFVEWLYIYLKTFKFDSLGTTSSIVTSINMKIIRDIRVRIPERVILSKFDIISRKIFKKIYANQQQIRTLEKLRDTLLPKLMSGEVRVRVDG